MIEYFYFLAFGTLMWPIVLKNLGNRTKCVGIVYFALQLIELVANIFAKKVMQFPSI